MGRFFLLTSPLIGPLKRHHGKHALAIATGLCMTRSAAPADKPAGIDVLRAYEGTWEITIDHLDTAQSKASHEKTSLRNDCWKSGGYFACNQYVDGESKVLLVFTYNQSKNE